MNIDVVCLSNSKNETLRELTKLTLYSLHDSEKDFKFNIHLVESYKGPHFETQFDYNDVVVNEIKPEEDFNYNLYLNKANPYLTSDWVIITNNDVFYERGWFSKIYEVHKMRPDIESFSPKDPCLYSKFFKCHFKNTNEDYWENYLVGEGLMGWSLIMKKSVWDIVYPWDEQFGLYYQDNDYSYILKKYNIKHALVRDSIATHLESKTVDVKFSSNNERNKIDYEKLKIKWNLK
jgi:hypothetical protein